MPRRESEASREGTLAHSLGELIIGHRKGTVPNKDFRKHLKIIEDNPLYSKAMYEYCDEYALFVLEQFAIADEATEGGAELLLEERLPIGDAVPDAEGTIDVTIIGDTTLRIIDLKYGKGVKVDAVGNAQLKLYALAAYEAYGWMYGITQVEMTIYQPRLHNISTMTLSVTTLIAWADTIVKPAAALAYAGKGAFKAGSYCTFCEAKPQCRAFADRQVRLANKDFAEFANEPVAAKNPALLTPSEVAAILTRSAEVKNWLVSVEKFALDQALAGKEWPGYKLVAGKGARQVIDGAAVVKALVKAGYDRHKMYKPQELVGVTALEALTGRKEFDALLGDYVAKVSGAPTLVDASDPRPPFKDVNAEFGGLPDTDD